MRSSTESLRNRFPYSLSVFAIIARGRFGECSSAFADAKLCLEVILPYRHGSLDDAHKIREDKRVQIEKQVPILQRRLARYFYDGMCCAFLKCFAKEFLCKPRPGSVILNLFGRLSPPTAKCMVLDTATVCPASVNVKAIISVTDDLPLVPVTATTVSPRAGKR